MTGFVKERVGSMSFEFCPNGCMQCTRQIDIFSTLPLESQEKVSRLAIHRVYEKGETIFREGDQADAFYVIHAGQVKLNSFDSEGKETIYEILSDQEVIAEDIFLEETAYPYSATCLVDTWTCQISRTDFIQLLMEEPETTLTFLGSMSRKLRAAKERSALLFENNAEVRLARFIYLQTLNNHGRNLELTVDEIAGSINLRRETVSRKIGLLTKRGFIERSGQSGIRILDLEGLHQFVTDRGSPLSTRPLD